MVSHHSDFTAWQKQLLHKMEVIGRCNGPGGLLIDTTIPYDLGWSPGRAAIAMLYIDTKDYKILVGRVKVRS